MKLTDIRFTAGENKQIVLQVCEQVSERDDFYPSAYSTKERWRDAAVEDLLDVADLLQTRWAGTNATWTTEAA